MPTNVLVKRAGILGASHVVLSTLLIVVIGSVLNACSPDPEALYNQGAHLAQQKKFDEAQAVYKQLNTHAGESVLYQYKSIYGQSEVARLRGDLVVQSELLNAILSQSKFKAHHTLVREKLEENLLLRAQKEKVKTDPSGAIPLYERALELSPKSEARSLLSDFLIAMANGDLAEHRYEQSIKTFQRVIALNASNETLTQRVQSQLNVALLAQYREGAERVFAKHVEALTRDKIYDPQTQTFFFKVTVMVPGRVTKKNQAEQLKVGRDLAASLAQTEVSTRIKDWFTLPTSPEVDLALITVTQENFDKRTKRVKIDGKRTRVTPYYSYFTLPLDAAYQLAFQVAKR